MTWASKIPISKRFIIPFTRFLIVVDTSMAFNGLAFAHFFFKFWFWWSKQSQFPVLIISPSPSVIYAVDLLMVITTFGHWNSFWVPSWCHPLQTPNSWQLSRNLINSRTFLGAPKPFWELYTFGTTAHKWEKLKSKSDLPIALGDNKSGELQGLSRSHTVHLVLQAINGLLWISFLVAKNCSKKWLKKTI